MGESTGQGGMLESADGLPDGSGRLDGAPSVAKNTTEKDSRSVKFLIP
jgi:hypothetical protein